MKARARTAWFIIAGIALLASASAASHGGEDTGAGVGTQARGASQAWIRYLEGRIRLAPEDALLRAALSRAYLGAGRFSEAARLARKEELGEILRASEAAAKNDAARREEALDVAGIAEGAGIPLSPAMRLLRARARLEAGETSPAFALLEATPRDEALLARALDAFARTNTSPADVLRLFRHYRGPLSPAAWEARAFAAWKTGDRALALSGCDSSTASEFLGRILAADPADREALLARAARAGDAESALRDLLRAHALGRAGPARPPGPARLPGPGQPPSAPWDPGIALYRAGRFPQALLLLDPARNPEEALAVAVKLGDIALAARLAEKLPLERLPDEMRVEILRRRAVARAEEGARALARGDRALSLSAYREAARLDTSVFSYAYNAALLSALAGEHRSARVFLDEAVRLRPDDAEALLQLAALQRRGGETREAVATYRRAIEAGAGPQAKYEAGLLLEATGETDGALAFYREAAVEFETAARRTVLLLERAGLLDEARQRLEALPDRPGDARIDRLRLRAALSRNDLSAAETYARRIGSDAAREIRARRDLEEGRVKPALAVLEPLTEGRARYDLYARAVEILLARGDLPAAAEVVERWGRSFPAEPSVRALARALRGGDSPKAAEKKGMRAAPLFVSDLEDRLREAYVARRYDEAKRLAARWRAARPADAKAWALIGLAFHEAGEIPSARDAWRRSLAIDPAQVDIERLLSADTAADTPAR